MNMLLIVEGIVLSFWLLIVCVTGIADGPHGLVVFYEQDVKDRVVQLGLLSAEEIRRKEKTVMALLFIPVMTAAPLMVRCINGAQGFRDCFVQMTVILLIMGLFDRFFIDWYWVGHTKVWIIPGTEDLMPYIPRKTVLAKWAGTLIGMPVLAALLAGILQLFG